MSHRRASSCTLFNCMYIVVLAHHHFAAKLNASQPKVQNKNEYLTAATWLHSCQENFYIIFCLFHI